MAERAPVCDVCRGVFEFRRSKLCEDDPIVQQIGDWRFLSSGAVWYGHHQSKKSLVESRAFGCWICNIIISNSTDTEDDRAVPNEEASDLFQGTIDYESGLLEYCTVMSIPERHFSGFIYVISYLMPTGGHWSPIALTRDPGKINYFCLAQMILTGILTLAVPVDTGALLTNNTSGRTHP